MKISMRTDALQHLGLGPLGVFAETLFTLGETYYKIRTRMRTDAQRDGPATHMNIGGALCESSVIPFLV